MTYKNSVISLGLKKNHNVVTCIFVCSCLRYWERTSNAMMQYMFIFEIMLLTYSQRLVFYTNELKKNNCTARNAALSLPRVAWLLLSLMFVFVLIYMQPLFLLTLTEDTYIYER